jgi:Recombinase
LHCIASDLARQQVPTTRGGQWYAGTVRYLLRNTLYAEEVA